MVITDIKIRKIIPDGRLRAVISITIDNQLAIHDIKVVQGDERLFVAMPSRKDENGRPTNSEYIGGVADYIQLTLREKGILK